MEGGLPSIVVGFHQFNSRAIGTKGVGLVLAIGSEIDFDGVGVLGLRPPGFEPGDTSLLSGLIRLMWFFRLL